MYARLARQKLGGALGRLSDGAGVRVGVLSPDPEADSTEVPIAIICEFSRAVSQDTLEEAQRLAWNFSRAPLLLTIEPHQVRTWSCYARPRRSSRNRQPATEIAAAGGQISDSGSLGEQLADSLHWLELVSGEFFRTHADQFRREERADRTLLQNLRFVRSKLYEAGLDYGVIHDLLGRIIFIQFLFHRADSNGVPALNASVLGRLHLRGELSGEYSELHQILRNRADTYQLFRWLNGIFNGDLFPGKGATPEEREAEWAAEIEQVHLNHLQLLADFVEGRMRMQHGQMSFWPEYYFDVIPLEFISSIYEEFVRASGASSGAHYTKSHLVDFLLDAVLPWDGEEWNMRILDPACGSGIFLVKAFQRLIYRWRRANPDQEPRAPLLRELIANNLFGVDNNEHAVRVASFSLYLAMCDEIDPRQYWTQVKFPRLRGNSLIDEDFFEDSIAGFSSILDRRRYDLVIGNAPWGKKSVTEKAMAWASSEWPISYDDVGPLFLAKAAVLTQETGAVAMVQSGGLLFNRGPNAERIREKLFTTFKVEEVVNFAAIRSILFENAQSPACSVLLRPVSPDGEPVVYASPKPVETAEDQYRIQIDPQDVHRISWREAAHDPLIWTVLMWGGRRDLVLIRRLSEEKTLQKLKCDGVAIIREGIIRGSTEYREILGWRMLEDVEFPEGTFLTLRAEELPKNTNPYVHRRTKLAAFELPQLVIKQSWRRHVRRFEAAATTRSDGEGNGVIPSQSYVSVSVSPQHAGWISSSCLALNSELAVYYLLLTSGRLAFYRTEPLVKEILDVPIPSAHPGDLGAIQSFAEVDRFIFDSFGLTESERVLVEDMLRYTLPDYKQKDVLPGWRRTRSSDGGGREPELVAYCNSLLSVLEAGFGEQSGITATILPQRLGRPLPVRTVLLRIGGSAGERIMIDQTYSDLLGARLERLHELFFSAVPRGSGIGYQRIARMYTTIEFEEQMVPAILVIKPDFIRFWTRSVAMRDGDEIAADIWSWRQSSSSRAI